MNIKNLLLPFTFALLTTWAIQYFINKHYFGIETNEGVVKSGKVFVAPQSQLEAQPLKREINFDDNDLIDTKSSIETSIGTDHATYVFSNKGAVLKQLIYKRNTNGEQITFSTVNPHELMQENQNFLVVLDRVTPLNYELLNQRKTKDAYFLVYKTKNEYVSIEKQFTISRNTFQIDLDLTITPRNETLQPRVFYSAPLISGIKNDTISAIYNTETGSIKKEARNKLDLAKGWFSPNMFGTESRYFIHAMTSDKNGFAQRAYYSLTGTSDIISILEGPIVREPAHWKLSFYMGPKEEVAVVPVDPRLEQTFEYSGWLAPLSRVLLMILKYLYKVLHNYGWAIVVMTLLINLVLLPLNIKGARSMKKDADVQKKLAYIQQRYKNDPEALARERTELINKYGVPGVGGCLPKLLQLPIFFALSRVLSSSIELYHAPFLWIKDLSATDPYFILPLLIMILMIFAATPTDPKQRFMMIAVALVFGAFAVNFSAGLCLYILVGVLLTGLQNVMQQRMNWA